MLSRAPFVGIVVCYMLGIGLVEYWTPDLPSIVPLLGCILFFIVAGFLYQRGKKTELGLCISFIFLLIGAYTRLVTEEKHQADEDVVSAAAYKIYHAEVISIPEKRQKSIRYEVLVHSLHNALDQQQTEVKALISIQSDAPKLRFGDHIVVKGKLAQPKETINPGQFDYKKYLRRKGIIWTDYLRRGDFRKVSGKKDLWSAKYLATALSDWADGVFRKQIADDESYGLVKAMILGRRDDLREEQVQDYVASGAVHILSVSGMHVAIIFLVLTFALGWLRKSRWGKAIYLASMFMFLGFYALVTGLSPSVQRAALMCIVFVLAEVFRRKQSPVNTLAIAALLILLLDPEALFDVGFQLSFLAMSGIFLFYKPISSVFHPDNRIFKFLWQTTALSLAAQLSTFPLSLLYFHQFPSYFWLMNPVIIAATNLLLPAALVLLLMPSELMQWPVKYVVEWSARLTNLAAELPQHLPGHIVDNLNLTIAEVSLLYALMLAGWYAWHSREYKYLKVAFALTLVFVTVSFSRSIQTFVTDEAVEFSLSESRAIGWKRGQRMYLLSTKALKTDPQLYDFNIKNYVDQNEIGEVIFLENE